MSNDNRKIIIVGAGLVGSLCACFMGQRGYDVTVYEKRSDIRKAMHSRGRSINLAISHRGRNALRQLGLEKVVLDSSIPMKGRLLHTITGQLESVPYDAIFNNCIYSVGRNFLNEILLNAAEKYDNVKVRFNCKLTKVDLRKEEIILENADTAETFSETADLIIGADGAYSKLRSAMLSTPMFQFSQTYIEHGYMELRVPPKLGDKLLANHLHIWPRGQFMMIGLPNKDNSWTITLFMPFEKFESLNSEENIIEFFECTFPDAIPLIGKEDLLDTFSSTKPSQLIYIKCSPHHYGSKFLLLGDAAHAMVPFYGQGMNAGFEDCTILNDLLDRNDLKLDEIIKLYSKIRVPNSHAICELAMYNYVEMRDLVSRKAFKLRKAMDETLFKLLPNMWVPLYNSVSFSTMEYRRCVENKRWQDKVLNYLLVATVTLMSLPMLHAVLLN